MDLAAVMDELKTRLDTIEGLRCFAFPPKTLTPPAAVVSYPETLNFDATYGRGMDRMTLPVIVVVGAVTDKSTRDELGAYCSGSGQRSVKAVLESGAYTSFDSVRVESIDFDAVTISGQTYMGALFTLDIGGSGA